MRHLYTLLFILLTAASYGQTALTSNLFNYHLIDRQEIRSGDLNTALFTSVKPYRRDAILSSLDSLESYSNRDVFNANYLHIDHSEFSKRKDLYQQKGLWSSFFKSKNALYQVDHSSTDGKLQFIINPVLDLNTGFELGDSSTNTYRNTRGFVIRGRIGDKIDFYTKATENQIKFPSYMTPEITKNSVIRGAGLYKGFGDNAYDYFNATGYITFSPVKEVMIQFGHDKNFIGNGYRSLILANDAVAYPFLKFSTKVWKINYTNLFMEHVDFTIVPVGTALKKKFSAFHHLSINLGKHLNIGLFENIVFDRQDSLENNQYDIQYLNPIIFYRSVEHGLNSTDNALLGMDLKWNFKKHFSIYGQFVLDEFVKKEFFSMSDNWVNKWAYQAGFKYIDVANISNLDLQLEVNQVRPFVYSHKFKSQNWAHYNQALAHPLGANFREFIAIIRYQPINRLNVDLYLSQTKQGIDISNVVDRYGANILLNNRDVFDRDHAPMFQGVTQTVSTAALQASYMLYHNLFLDLGLSYRSSELASIKTDLSMISFGLRLNAFNAKPL